MTTPKPPAAVLPATSPMQSGRASSRRRVRPLRYDLLLSGVIVLAFAICLAVAK